ncbi:hypothetical protein ACI513_19195 [Chryseobacterium sp. M5]|uniref:hypothetical protein n=1 Tax=Chryseobacterium sp. M5 TaxID=3379128 RepID=UPI003857F575
MKLGLQFLAILILCSCSITKLNYKPSKIFALERKGHIIQFNYTSTKFRHLELDPNNVKEVIKNSYNKTLNIISKNPNSEFINGFELIEKIRNETKQNFDLVVISGVPYGESDLKNLQIEQSIYKDYKILSAEELNNNTTFCRGFDNGILFVTLK